MATFFRALLVSFLSFLLVMSVATAHSESSGEGAEPVVEGLVDPKPGDVFGGKFWDKECVTHLDNAIESISYAKLHDQLTQADCNLNFKPVCSGIHPVVTVDGCSLKECQAMVEGLCEQGKGFFAERAKDAN